MKRSLQTRTTTFHSTPIVQGFLNQKYPEIVKQKEKFTDPLFPPNETSLYSTKQDHIEFKPIEVPSFLKEAGGQEKFLSQFAISKRGDQYKWKRLSEVYNLRDLNVLKEIKAGESLSDDVIQGELGDCYFLSALACLAENPERIKKLFPTFKLSDKGVFETLVYLHGDPTNIVLDDYVPFIDLPGYEPQIAFAGLNEKTKNIWPILLEKVWAKCNLSYEDIAAGNSAEAFEFLCPAPFDTFYHNVHTETLFDVIKDAFEKGYIIVSDITETEKTNIDYLSKMGLVTNHAYSIIGVTTLKAPMGKNEIRLLKIRNPWGTNEWLGDWSDGSRQWTQEFKEKVGLEEKEDGVFWMCYEDFIQFYTATHICHIHDNYEFVSKKFMVQSEEPFNIVKVDIPKKSSGYFEVNLKNTRIYKNLKGLDEFENPYCSMTVFKKEGNRLVYIGSDSGKQDRLYVECENMERGNYYVAVTFPKKRDYFELNNQVQARNFEKMSYRVGIYSPFETLNLKEVTERERYEIGNFLDSVISGMAEKSTNKYYFVNEGERTSWRTIHFENSNSGFGYIYYENNSDAYIRERAKITELNGVNIVPILQKGKFIKLETTIDEEVEYEDPSTRVAMDTLKKNAVFDSTVDVIKGTDNSKAVSPRNPVYLQFNVAPHSTCIILLQKNDDEASIDIVSEICFDYLPSVLIAEEIFRPKKVMLKFNEVATEIYECITEHNTGIFFQYKNKTRDIRLTVTVTFKNLNNLYLALVSDEIERGLRESIKGRFREEDDSNSVTLVIPPGKNKFFGIRAVDCFKRFGYSCDMEYHFTSGVEFEDEIQIEGEVEKVEVAEEEAPDQQNVSEPVEEQKVVIEDKKVSGGKLRSKPKPEGKGGKVVETQVSYEVEEIEVPDKVVVETKKVKGGKVVGRTEKRNVQEIDGGYIETREVIEEVEGPTHVEYYEEVYQE